ncbi:hypothetical protein HHK36_030094 [Tetracentron sinense]|uniref:Uncharacterized protein n=1 Tax=Tetracentron sinense TaxID=13715 RepID=A0A835D0B7_TETSI|nr:hypothetical protein HHK36_030094 [Tetracentron sinense]
MVFDPAEDDVDPLNCEDLEGLLSPPPLLGLLNFPVFAPELELPEWFWSGLALARPNPIPQEPNPIPQEQMGTKLIAIVIFESKSLVFFPQLVLTPHEKTEEECVSVFIILKCAHCVLANNSLPLSLDSSIATNPLLRILRNDYFFDEASVDLIPDHIFSTSARNFAGNQLSEDCRSDLRFQLSSSTEIGFLANIRLILSPATLVQDMGEIDTKSIESVQVALSLFGEKNDQKKYRSTGSDEFEKERVLDLILKDVANYKVQLEVKESSYMQALLKLELCQKTVLEQSAQLKNSEAQREKYIEECREARTRIDRLESVIKEISDQLLETGKARERLLHAENELKATQDKLLNMKAELAAAEESKLAALTQAELMETFAHVEKEKTDELLKHISELNEAILLSKLAAIEAEKEKSAILSEKEAEIQMATAAAIEAQEQLEEMREKMDTMDDLENQLLAKSLFVDSLQLELKQVQESHNLSTKAASDAINDLNQLKSELELMGRANSEQAIYVESMETELKQLHRELKNMQEEVGISNRGVEMLTSEIQKARKEMNEIRGRESEAQIEIANLKSELHKGRSKIAAAEAAEARAMSVKSGLYLAVTQLAVEAEEAKKETRMLKQEAKKAEEIGNSALVKSPQSANCSRNLELTQTEKFKTEVEESRSDSDAQITISMKEYESLIRKAEQADQVAEVSPSSENELQLTTSGNRCEVHDMRKELEAAMAQIEEITNVAEQAVSRAELAESAKTVIEDQLRQWRDQKQKRRAALSALREESGPKISNPSKNAQSPTTYQPLGKVLNMEF